MKCPHCGRIIAENSKFCEFCGRPTTKKPEPKVDKKMGNRWKSFFGTFFIITGLAVGAYALWLYVTEHPIQTPFDNTEEVIYPTGYDAVLSERRLTESDLVGKSAWELKVMRNSIYARYGLSFQGGKLYRYFSQYDWYHPSESNQGVVYNKMTDIEKYNVGVIRRYEKSQGYR